MFKGLGVEGLMIALFRTVSSFVIKYWDFLFRSCKLDDFVFVRRERFLFCV